MSFLFWANCRATDSDERIFKLLSEDLELCLPELTQRAITNTNMVKFRLSIINCETKANCSLIEEKFLKAKKRMALAKDRREQILYLRELPVYSNILRSLREDMQVEIWCKLDERDRGQRNIEVMATYLIIINFWPGNIFEERTPAEIDR